MEKTLSNQLGPSGIPCGSQRCFTRGNVKIGLWFLALYLFSLSVSVGAQPVSAVDRDRVQYMLRTISADIKKHYYDPKLHGVNWDDAVAEARSKIEKTDSLNMAMSHLAAALDSLNDSHTFFLPPPRPYHHDYGWQAQMFGDHCYVTRVRPDSDAAAQGLAPGDEILAINGYKPSRDNFWKMEYVYHTLRPQPGLRLTLKNPDGKERQLDIKAKLRVKKRIADLTGASNDIFDFVREGENIEHSFRGRSVDVGDDVTVLKMARFAFSDSEISAMMGKARKRKALILDLRGNLGGSLETFKYLLGYLLDKEVKIADRVERSKITPVTAHPHDLFPGRVVVLVDSKSASAAEMLARVLQIEKRGLVLGDTTSGMVMEAKHYTYEIRADTVVYFGASITDADLIMADGKSLEHIGVIPDETVLPTTSDLATGSDPVLARAAELLGVKLSAERAGKLFPFEWPRE